MTILTAGSQDCRLEMAPACLVGRSGRAAPHISIDRRHTVGLYVRSTDRGGMPTCRARPKCDRVGVQEERI